MTSEADNLALTGNSQTPSQALSVLSTGYITLDILMYESTVRHAAGGTAGNVAANLAWLGVSSAVVGAIGSDSGGALVRTDLELAGVDTSLLTSSASAGTPTLIHQVRRARHRYLSGCVGCGRKFPRYRPLSADTAANLIEALRFRQQDRPTVFFVDRANAFTVAMARALKAQGSQVILEPSTPGPAGALEALASVADVIKISTERLGTIADRLSQIGHSAIEITTDGANGVSVARKGLKQIRVRAPEVDVVDAGGAGDYFTAYMIALVGNRAYSDLTEGEWREIVAASAAAASLSCSYAGARGLARQFSSQAVAAEVCKTGADSRATQTPGTAVLSWPSPAAHQSCEACLA